MAIEKLGHGFLNRRGLDDSGPRKTTRWHSRNGVETRRDGADPVFAATLEFFRERLKFSWSGFDIRCSSGRGLAKRMSNPKLH
jgi:hypothetical protein